MRSLRNVLPVLFAGVLICLALSVGGAAQTIPNFTFIHASDVHAPTTSSQRVCAEMAKIGAVEIKPGLTAEAPSFVVVSGDLTEFGGGNGVWDTYLSYWKDFTIPVYHTLGNHDGPWWCCRGKIYDIYGSQSWSFDSHGCHFIGLDNASPQDPRATISKEQFQWLKEDLKRVDKDAPVFVVMHHPLSDDYFGSPYATGQLLDILRSYNLVAFLGGHGHNHKVSTFFGVDSTDGGATSGPEPKVRAGYSIVSVIDGTLRISFKEYQKDSIPHTYVEKPLPTKASYPKIDIRSPRENSTTKSGSLLVKAKISGNGSPITTASFSEDRKSFPEEDKGEEPMALTDGEYVGEVHYEDWTPGAHNLRVRFVDEAGKKYYKSVRFNVEPEPSRLLWRALIDGSCRAAPGVSRDAVYVGGTDRKLYAFDKATGKKKWTFPTKGDVATTPVIVDETIYFGCADGKLYALDMKGKEKWHFQAKEGIYSSPVYADGVVMFGCNDSDFYGIDAKTGEQKWVLTDPTYTIEVRPFVYNGVAYFGAWDTFVYAVDVATGKLKWKSMGYACTQKTAAVRYYSPADNGPVVTNGKVFIADRDSQLGIMNALTGDMRGNASGPVAVGIAEDAKAVYVRKSYALAKLDLNGDEIWKAPADVGSVPASPIEKDGVVYVVSNLGLVQAFDAADGKPLWKYQATPLLYVFDQVTVADGVVYVSGMDGSITAIKAK